MMMKWRKKENEEREGGERERKRKKDERVFGNTGDDSKRWEEEKHLDDREE